jgi:hypothetical protein
MAAATRYSFSNRAAPAVPPFHSSQNRRLVEPDLATLADGDGPRRDGAP